MHKVNEASMEPASSFATRQAFQAFAKAIETGDTADFLALADDDFHFFVPLPLDGWKEKQQGKRRFNDLVRFEREILRVTLTSLLELSDSKRGVVIFRAEGLLDGLPYRNELTIAFEFEDGRIRSFREYVGMPQRQYG